MRPARFGGRLAAGVEVGWYAATAELSTAGEPVQVDVIAAPVLARVTWDPFPAAGFYFGPTAGLFLARTAISSPTAGESASFQPSPAFGAVAGWELPVGAWRQADVGGRVRGNLGGLGAGLAYRREF